MEFAPEHVASKPETANALRQIRFGANLASFLGRNLWGKRGGTLAQMARRKAFLPRSQQLSERQREEKGLYQMRPPIS